MNSRELRNLERLVAEAPVAAWLKLDSGRFLALSPCLAVGLGLAPGDTPRAGDEEFFTPSEVERFRVTDRRARSTGRAQVTLEPPDSLTPAAWGATLKIPVRSSGAIVGFSFSLGDLVSLEDVVRSGDITGDGEPVTAERVRSLLDRSFQEPVRVSRLALALRRHPDHLARCFRRSCGATIARYLRARRVAWAASRLGRTDHPLALLALDAGFCDQSHLTHAFREVLGTTPALYRRQGAAPPRYRRLASSGDADPIPLLRRAIALATRTP